MANLKELNDKIDALAADLKAAGADVRTVSQGADNSALVESMEQKVDAMHNAFTGARASKKAEAKAGKPGVVALSPSSAMVKPFETQQFTASGGKAPYTFSVASAEVGGFSHGEVDAFGTYTAGRLSGKDVLSATDANHQVGSITVTVGVA